MSRRTSHASHQSRRASKLDVSKNQDDDEEASDKANTPKAISRFVDKSYQPVIVTGHDDSTIRFWTKNASEPFKYVKGMKKFNFFLKG